MRPSEPDRARWAEMLAQTEEEIDALELDLKASQKSARGTVAELRKRAKRLLRYITGKEHEPLELPGIRNAVAGMLEKAAQGDFSGALLDAERAQPQPLPEVPSDCDPAWVKLGGSHMFQAGKCERCGKSEAVAP